MGTPSTYIWKTLLLFICDISSLIRLYSLIRRYSLTSGTSNVVFMAYILHIYIFSLIHVTFVIYIPAYMWHLKYAGICMMKCMTSLQIMSMYICMSMLYVHSDMCNIWRMPVTFKVYKHLCDDVYDGITYNDYVYIHEDIACIFRHVWLFEECQHLCDDVCDMSVYNEYVYIREYVIC